MWAFLSGTVTFLDGAVNHCLSTLQQIPCLVSQRSGGASGCRHPEMTLKWGWEAGRLNEPGRWPSISQTHVGPNFSQNRSLPLPLTSKRINKPCLFPLQPPLSDDEEPPPSWARPTHKATESPESPLSLPATYLSLSSQLESSLLREPFLTTLIKWPP